jgi:hypothetical protein
LTRGGTVGASPEEITRNVEENARRSRPWVRDLCVFRSGEAYRRAGRSKAIAAAHGGLHVSRGSAYRRGDGGSPLAHAMLYLAQSDRTSAFPAVTEARALVLELEVDHLATPVLATRRTALLREVVRLHADLCYALLAGDPAGCAAALAPLADAATELLAIERALLERND